MPRTPGRKRFPSRLAAILILLATILPGGLAPAKEKVTSLVEIRPDPVRGVVRLLCDGPFQFTRESDPDPAHVKVNLPWVRNGIKGETIKVDSGLIGTIRVGALGGSTPEGSRVIVELRKPAPVQLIQTGDTLQVVLNPTDPPEGPPDPSPVAQAAPLGTSLAAGTPPEAGSQAPAPSPPASPNPVAGSATAVRPNAAAVGPSADYVIGKEDLLELGVFQQPDLTRIVRVSGDGTISLPLLGVIAVDGLTTKQAEAKLRDLLAERYLTDPQVWVFVKEAKSKKISVVGAVEKPGTIEMLGSRTLLEAISEAGGLTQQAGGQLYVIRPDPSGASTRIDVDLDDLMINGNPELNIPILPGDVINVPIDRILHVYVDGAVRKPGEVEYKASRPLNLIQAIAAAGGLSERASQKGILVIRNRPGREPERIKVDLKAVRKGEQENLLLSSGDSVYVPETFF